MAWTNLSFAYGSVLTSAKMTQLYDNFAALATGASGAPSITAVGAAGVLANGVTATTQAVGDDSTKVATTAFCEAGFVNNDIGVGGVGSLMRMRLTSGTVASGATVAGSNLNFTFGSLTGDTLSVGVASGTWRNISSETATTTKHAVFQRIA